jgi:hypothetical protein
MIQHAIMHEGEAKRPTKVGPVRTCAGCQKQVAQHELVRAVSDTAGRLRFDQDMRRAAGRGVYVHRRSECIKAALRGGFARSLRRKVVVSDVAVHSELGFSAAQPERPGPRQSLAASTQASDRNQDNHS